ncbi:hypothetical protein I552_0573 [Mycobacterium xenopi 3993]|nr:hypothetical protein I552_0573 [Mycobacterium xenopi 3993]
MSYVVAKLAATSGGESAMPADDLRFDVPLYTLTEASRYLIVPRPTLTTWIEGYERRPPAAPAVKKGPIITAFPERERDAHASRLSESRKPTYSTHFAAPACPCNASDHRSTGC